MWKSARVEGATGLPSWTTASLRTPSRSRKTALGMRSGYDGKQRPRRAALPLGSVNLERGMGHQEMPQHRLESLRVRRDVGGVHGGDEDARVRGLRGVAAVAANDAGDGGAGLLGVLDGGDEVGAHLFFDAAAADGEDEQRVFGFEAASAQPGLEDGRPAFVVGAGRELADVVGGR